MQGYLGFEEKRYSFRKLLYGQNAKKQGSNLVNEPKRLLTDNEVEPIIRTSQESLQTSVAGKFLAIPGVLQPSAYH